ncbi:MAG TPA: outer membrane beta-barrel protein [Microvirga sp.]|jgi:outer membrane immunogenic protein|nr:outer membrane beta-barrel protein [Microvirga sp.]
MKAVLLAGAAVLGLLSQAGAADLPRKAVALPPAPAIAPSFIWTGFYAGVHGVWVRNDAEATRRTFAPAGTLPRRLNLEDDGFGGGGQVGYLMQWGDTVVGLEADITATDVGRTRTSSFTIPTVPPVTFATRLGSEMEYFGTLKGRVGFSFPSFLPMFQQTMVYATGGLGYAGIDNSLRLTGSAPGFGSVSFNGRGDDMKAGFVVGGGTESAITNTISLKTETLYYNLEDETVALRGGAPRVGYRFENDGWISRVGLNIRFGTL